jgi:hypothetical protein
MSGRANSLALVALEHGVRQGDVGALQVDGDAPAHCARQDFEQGPVLAEAATLFAKARFGAALALHARAHFCAKNVNK